MGFFKIALEEISDFNSETIRYNSLAHRLSKLEQKDFEVFMRDDKGKPKTKIIVDHKAQLEQSQRM